MADIRERLANMRSGRAPEQQGGNISTSLQQRLHNMRNTVTASASTPRTSSGSSATNTPTVGSDDLGAPNNTTTSVGGDALIAPETSRQPTNTKTLTGFAAGVQANNEGYRKMAMGGKGKTFGEKIGLISTKERDIVTPTTLKTTTRDGTPVITSSGDADIDAYSRQMHETTARAVEDKREGVDEVDYGKLFAGTARKGINQFASGLTSTADWLVGQPLQAIGWKNNPVSLLNQEIKNEAALLNSIYDENAAKSIPAQLTNKYGPAIVAALPQAALAYFTASASVSAQGSTKGLQLISNAAQNSGLISTIVNAARTMMSDLQFWLPVAQTAGISYEQARADGADDLHASVYATVNGLVNGLIERGGGGIQDLPAQLRSGNPSLIRSWVFSSLNEGKEEVVQGVIDRGLENLIYGENNPVFSTTDSNAIFNPRTMAEDAMGGMVVSGALGGGQVMVNNAVQNQNARQGGVNGIDYGTTEEYAESKQNIKEVTYGTAEDGTYNRGWQDAGRTDSKLPDGYTIGNGDERGWNFGHGNLGVHAGNLISPKARAKMSQKGIPNIELRETTDRAAFSAALDAAKAANPNGGMVDPQSVSALEENGARMFMRADGNAGAAVEKSGNIVGVFKNPAYKQRGAVNDIIYATIAQGGNHLDCYATYANNDLRYKYSQLGFEPVAYLEFNREYAPDGWNYEAWGTPDVVLWVHNGETIEQMAERETPYKKWSKEDIHALPKFDDYDAAKAYQMEQVAKRQNAARKGSDSVASPTPMDSFPYTEALIRKAEREGNIYTKRLLENELEETRRKLEASISMPTIYSDRLTQYGELMGFEDKIDSHDLNADFENDADSGIMFTGAVTDGFDRKASITSAEEDLIEVNPNYVTKSYEWTNNCQRCVPAYEMRRRGFKVVARPLPGKVLDDILANNAIAAWKRQERVWCIKGNGLQQIKEQMSKWGNGARAEVSVAWRDDYPHFHGHVFIAEQRNGRTVFMDPQTGDSDCSRYFDMVVRGRTSMWRIDDNTPSDLILECCMNEGAKK